MPLMPTRQCSDVGITTLLGRKSGLRLLTRLDLIHVMSSHRRKPLGGIVGWVEVTCGGEWRRWGWRREWGWW